MATQTRKERPHARTSTTQPPAKDVRTKDAKVRTAEETAKAAAELDAVLENIDAVLIGNAQEFVESYTQKGGQ